LVYEKEKYQGVIGRKDNRKVRRKNVQGGGKIFQ